jgi:hypothetical protein
MRMAGLAARHDIGTERRRLSALVRLAATAGGFSPKLSAAVDRATDAEVTVMADLVARGLSIPDLVHVLQGAHLLVGDDVLYERWIFPHSRKRMSSHHRTVDKKATPDFGLDGPLVRESLHGKAAQGTWVQLERTKATFQWGQMPTWHDVVHVRDFVVYRVTGKNVGPWGLSAHVDTRPIYLRPANATPGEGADAGLAAMANRRLEVSAAEGDLAAWSDLLTPEVEPVGPAGRYFVPPDPVDPHDLLPDAPYRDELGAGLFGSLDLVRAQVELPENVRAVLDRPAPAAGAAGLGPQDGPIEHVTVTVGATAVRVAATVAPPVGQRALGLEEAS